MFFIKMEILCEETPFKNRHLQPLSKYNFRALSRAGLMTFLESHNKYKWKGELEHSSFLALYATSFFSQWYIRNKAMPSPHFSFPSWYRKASIKQPSPQYSPQPASLELRMAAETEMVVMKKIPNINQ